MALDTPTSPTLEPQLYEDWDDEDDLRWKAPLDSLIKATQTPLQAAQQIDTMVRAETSSRLQKLIEYANSHNLTAEDRESGDWDGLYPPNSGAIAQEILRSWCRVCTAFSPYSEGQNRLIEFLERLRDLPRWMGPESRPDEHGDVSESELWPFGYGWLGLEDEFRKHHVGKLLGLLLGYSGRLHPVLLANSGEKHGKRRLLTIRTEVKPHYYRDDAAHNRWRNFQHTMARVTAMQLIYCAPFNALSDLVLSGDPESKPSFEFDIVAAAQWVVWPVECRYVYQECLKKETTTEYWKPWSKDRWEQWKGEFERVGKYEKYDEKTRSVASQALSRMRDVEEEIDEEGSGGSDSD